MPLLILFFSLTLWGATSESDSRCSNLLATTSRDSLKAQIRVLRNAPRIRNDPHFISEEGVKEAFLALRAELGDSLSRQELKDDPTGQIERILSERFPSDVPRTGKTLIRGSRKIFGTLEDAAAILGINIYKSPRSERLNDLTRIPGHAVFEKTPPSTQWIEERIELAREIIDGTPEFQSSFHDPSRELEHSDLFQAMNFMRYRWMQCRLEGGRPDQIKAYRESFHTLFDAIETVHRKLGPYCLQRFINASKLENSELASLVSNHDAILLTAVEKGRRHAIERYDTSRGIRFSTFAWKFMKGQFNRALEKLPMLINLHPTKTGKDAMAQMSVAIAQKPKAGLDRRAILFEAIQIFENSAPDAYKWEFKRKAEFFRRKYGIHPKGTQHYAEPQTYPEIAGLLGISHQAVSGSIANSEPQLKTIIQELVAREESPEE